MVKSSIAQQLQYIDLQLMAQQLYCNSDIVRWCDIVRRWNRYLDLHRQLYTTAILNRVCLGQKFDGYIDLHSVREFLFDFTLVGRSVLKKIKY